MDGSWGVEPGFTRALDELKERGSTVLVTGRATDGAWRRASTRLLGRLRDRVRVLAMVDADVGTARRRLRAAGARVDRSIVVDGVPEGTRAVTAGTSGDGGFDVRPAAASPGALERELLGAVEECRRRFGPLDAGQLRLGVDSLRPLGRSRDPGTVRAFVDRVGGSVADASGMAHFLLPGDVDGDVAGAVRPVCDVVVELRMTGGAPEQRWLLPAYDETSPWIEI